MTRKIIGASRILNRATIVGLAVATALAVGLAGFVTQPADAAESTYYNVTSLDALWTGRIPTERGGQYGYGCHVREYNGTRIIWHGGGWVGITNQFEMYPDLGYTVVILCNIDNNPTAIAMKLREWLTQGTTNPAEKPATKPAEKQ